MFSRSAPDRQTGCKEDRIVQESQKNSDAEFSAQCISKQWVFDDNVQHTTKWPLSSDQETVKTLINPSPSNTRF